MSFGHNECRQIDASAFWHNDCLFLSHRDAFEPFTEIGWGASGCNRQNVMFRITVEEGPTEERWILQGQLTGDFASELGATWRSVQARDSGRVRVVDLSDVTVIDKNGQEVLLAMIRQGARCVAKGVYTSHLLKELKSR
jgi:ABC-type transporter Mla MlaB component